jgi:hypothetical protein
MFMCMMDGSYCMCGDSMQHGVWGGKLRSATKLVDGTMWRARDVDNQRDG